MNIHEHNKEIQNFNRALINKDWNFKKYFNKDIDLNYYENFDEMIDILNIVNEFYLNEAFISWTKNNNDDNSYGILNERRKEELKQIFELHDLLIKTEYIYFYKLKRILDIPEIFERITEWIKFTDEYLIFSDILFTQYSYFDTNRPSNPRLLSFQEWGTKNFSQRNRKKFRKFY